MKIKTLKAIKHDFLQSPFKDSQINKVLYKDLQLFIECTAAGNYKPMFNTDLYINKGGCYCELIRYFYNWKTNNKTGFEKLLNELSIKVA